MLEAEVNDACLHRKQCGLALHSVYAKAADTFSNCDSKVPHRYVIIPARTYESELEIVRIS
jgi:hypothetical protein